jgi:hypothetical protein
MRNMSMQNNAVEIQFPLYATGRPLSEGGPSDTPRSGSGRLPRVTQVMALAIQFQSMIARGDARDYADLARLGCLTRERMSQIMELVWLAPDIQREILEFPPQAVGRFPISEVAVRRIASLLLWAEQRADWNRLKSSSIGSTNM